MAKELTDWEFQILREVAGEIPASPWGAAVGAALEYLAKSGYTRFDRLTDKGHEYIKLHRHKPVFGKGIIDESR